ncbi:hypothetical protein [Candidatus Erwinia haradaeae]|nr:hypothetical protein [Candidatus Erwinia haradaeae]
MFDLPRMNRLSEILFSENAIKHADSIHWIKELALRILNVRAALHCAQTV